MVPSDRPRSESPSRLAASLLHQVGKAVRERLREWKDEAKEELTQGLKKAQKELLEEDKPAPREPSPSEKL